MYICFTTNSSLNFTMMELVVLLAFMYLCLYKRAKKLKRMKRRNKSMYPISDLFEVQKLARKQGFIPYSTNDCISMWQTVGPVPQECTLIHEIARKHEKQMVNQPSMFIIYGLFFLGIVYYA